MGMPGGIVVGGGGGSGSPGVTDHGALTGLGDDDHTQYALRAQPVLDHGNSGAAETIDAEAGDWQQLTLDDNCTITVTGFTVDVGRSVMLKVIQDGGGGNAIVWDADVLFAGDDQPNQAGGDVTWYLLWTDEGNSVIYATIVGAVPTGGLSQEFVGYNTVGGSFESLTANRLYAKKITLAEPGLLTNIEAHVKGNAANVGAICAFIMADVAGAPGKLLAFVVTFSDTVFLTTTAGWIGMPMGKWLPAGDYWIGVFTNDTTNTDAMQCAYDAGADKIAGTGGQWMTDGSSGGLTWTDSTRKYSIRANVVR